MGEREGLFVRVGRLCMYLIYCAIGLAIARQLDIGYIPYKRNKHSFKKNPPQSHLSCLLEIESSVAVMELSMPHRSST